jgi:hypothetical protein
VLGFQRVGRDIDEIRRHLVVELANDPDPAVRRQALPAKDWDYLVAHPDEELPPNVLPMEEVERKQSEQWRIAYSPPPSSMPQPPDVSTVGAIARWAAQTPRDLDQHAQALAQFAEGRHVVELSKRRESAALLLGGRPKSLLSFCAERDALQDAIHWAVRTENPAWLSAYTHGALASLFDTLSVSIPDCDALFLDTLHSGERIYQELTRHSPRVHQVIAIRGTAAFGDVAEGSHAPGLYFGIAKWQEEEAAKGRRWVRVYRSDVQYGLSIYSCNPNARDIDTGPGTELAAMLRQMGIVSSGGCDCKARQATMDQWGVDKCRERIDEIVGWITEGAPRWGWAERLKAAALAVVTGIAWQIDPTDPYRSLVTIAIDRAEAKAKGGAA